MARQRLGGDTSETQITYIVGDDEPYHNRFILIKDAILCETNLPHQSALTGFMAGLKFVYRPRRNT